MAGWHTNPRGASANGAVAHKPPGCISQWRRGTQTPGAYQPMAPWHTKRAAPLCVGK